MEGLVRKVVAAIRQDLAKIPVIIALLLFFASGVEAQKAIGGYVGMVVVPEAQLVEDANLSFGMYTNPKKYLLIDIPNREDRGNGEKIFHLNIGYIPRVNVILNVTRIDKGDSIGIGDRAALVSYQVLKETEKLPAVVLNVDVPLSVNQFLAGNHLVLSKRFWDKSLVTTLGYGFPFTLGRSGGAGGGLLGDFDLARFRRKESDYLNGLFFGARYNWNNVYTSMEYDSHKVNVEIGARIFSSLNLETYVLGFSRLGFGFSYELDIK